jgi:hypothetical protein
MNGARSQPVAGTGRTQVSNSPAIEALARKCREQGATVERTGGGHVKVVGPGGVVYFGSTPSASSLAKTKAQLRNAGITV